MRRLLPNKRVAIGIVVLAALPDPWAHAAVAVDFPLRVTHAEEVHRLQLDGTDDATTGMTLKVLKASALQEVKQVTVNYSKSAQTLKVIEAYTLKADGRRLDVPPDNYQVHSEAGQGNAGPAFSDQVSTTFVFPDVEVGDSVSWKYELKTIEPLFPGKVSLVSTYPQATPYDDVRVVIDAPKSLKAHRWSNGMVETTSEHDDREVIEWTLKNPYPVHTRRQNYTVLDLAAEPGFMYSTFDSYADIADAYARRADPKAAVTPRIQALADKITAGRGAGRAQVKALYEWVATNITYGGNCIGIGAVVPRDLDTVLDNRMGDCKDHATLLQALLTAKGIDSRQALVNASNIYRLPEVPVASLVNHVITYVPSLKLFLDSTASQEPFGFLPLQDQDKPVLMADYSGPPLRTPVDKIGGNWQRMQMTLSIAPDGSAQGAVKVSLRGQYGVTARSAFKQLSKDDEPQFVTNVLAHFGLKGQGTLEHSPTADLADEFDYDVRFAAKDVIPYPGTGAFQLGPTFYSVAPVVAFATQANNPVEDVDQACSSGTSEEDYDVTLPAGMRVLSVPDGIAFNTPLVSYESSYALQGAKLRAQRKLEDRSPGNVCSAQTMRTYQAALAPVWKNVRQQVLYK